MKYIFLFILFVGLLIRLILVGNTGFLADIAFWKSWSLAALDHGIVWTTYNTNINYPPGFIYVLWLMGKLYTFFGDPHDFSTFWRENNFAFLLVSKSIGIASDIAIACLIYWFFSQTGKLKKLGATLSILAGDASPSTSLRVNEQLAPSLSRGQDPQIKVHLPLLLSSIFFLNPIVILDSALWGQVESFGILFTLVAIILLFYRRPYLATFIFTIGTLMKLQNIIFIPLYFLFIFRFFDLKTAVKSIGVAAFSFFLVNLPFVLQHDLSQVLYLMTVNSDYFPWLSLNANNLWWIVAKASGMKVTDRITVLGILNAKTVGLLIFSACYLLSMILLFLKSSPRNLLLSFTFGIFSFFLFTTQSHERYSYPVIVLLLFLYPFLEEKFTNFRKFSVSKYFWLIYLLLTAAIFLNIHTGLILNYPENGANILTRLTTPTLTIANSYFLILLFFLLLPFVFSQISWVYPVVCCLLFVICLTILNSAYLIKGSVSLTSFKPTVAKQDYGSLQIDRSVNSYSGWKSWNRLSSNYFYFRRGFGTHANSTIVFDIDKKFKKFATDYGIDTEAGTPSSVIFKIYGDEKELFVSSKMGRFDFPRHVEVEVSGVKHLKLMVTDAGDGINNDHADWLNPVLFK